MFEESLSQKKESENRRKTLCLRRSAKTSSEDIERWRVRLRRPELYGDVLRRMKRCDVKFSDASIEKQLYFVTTNYVFYK